MNYALKGAFLSGLVFPGLGQIGLGHRKRGAAILLTTVLGLSVMVLEGVQHVLAVLDGIASQGGAISLSTISKAAAQTSTASASFTFDLAFWLVSLCWIVAVVDAYGLGKRKDIEEGSRRRGRGS